ncbi:hypothetical protein [Nonomuraea terrae]|uniref:hypothetical protein n=1 Tax=Nonomuraea terrae TaxID=2530383 RepID=UPI001404B121|nr:hypothetical protein [Nonomuraea terrae]
MRPLGVVVLQSPLSGDEMPPDQVGEVTRERTQLLQDLLVQLLRRDVGRDLGQPLPLRGLGLIAVGPAVTRTGAGVGALLTTFT